MSALKLKKEANSPICSASSWAFAVLNTATGRNQQTKRWGSWKRYYIELLHWMNAQD